MEEQSIPGRMNRSMPRRGGRRASESDECLNAMLPEEEPVRSIPAMGKALTEENDVFSCGNCPLAGRGAGGRARIPGDVGR